MTDELGRIAIHEAGHAAVAWVLGRRVTGVTVVPGRRWAGSTHYGRPLSRGRDWARWARLDPSAPVTLWPATVRRSIEIKALCAAAGDAAEHVLWWPTQRTARRPAPVVEQAAEAAGHVPLTSAERLRLAAAEVDTQNRTDAELLADIAELVYPGDLGLRVAWLAWVDAEARSIVAGSAERIERLGAVLADRGRLSGKAVREILAAR